MFTVMRHRGSPRRRPYPCGSRNEMRDHNKPGALSPAVDEMKPGRYFQRIIGGDRPCRSRSPTLLALGCCSR